MSRTHARLTMLIAAGLGLAALTGCAPGGLTSGGSGGTGDYAKICDLPAEAGEVSTPITVEEFREATGIDLAGTISGAAGGHVSVEPVCIADNGQRAYHAAFLSPNHNDVGVLYDLARDGGWVEDVPPGDSAARTYAQLKWGGGLVQIYWVPDLAVDSPGLGLSGPATRISVGVGYDGPPSGGSGGDSDDWKLCEELMGGWVGVHSSTPATVEEFKKATGVDLTGNQGGLLGGEPACIGKASGNQSIHYVAAFFSPNPDDVDILYDRARDSGWASDSPGDTPPVDGGYGWRTATLSRDDGYLDIYWEPDIARYVWADELGLSGPATLVRVQVWG